GDRLANHRDDFLAPRNQSDRWQIEVSRKEPVTCQLAGGPVPQTVETLRTDFFRIEGLEQHMMQRRAPGLRVMQEHQLGCLEVFSREAVRGLRARRRDRLVRLDRLRGQALPAEFVRASDLSQPGCEVSGLRKSLPV